MRRASTALGAALLVLLAATVVHADRESAEFFAKRGETALSDGDAAEAEKQFRRALEEDTTYAPARFGLSRALLLADRRDEGLAALQKAIEELSAESSWSSDRKKAEKLLAELDKAGAALRKLVSDHADALVSFAKKWRRKDEQVCVRALRTALEISPGHEKASSLIEELGHSAKGPPQELFDGETLTGWAEMSAPRWQAKDGAIVGDVKDAAYIGRSLAFFEGDVDVRAEMRMVEDHEGPSLFAFCPAYDGKDGHYTLGILKGKFFFQEDVDPDTEREFVHTNPPHEFEETDWHVYEVRIRGNSVTAYVDGVEIGSDSERPASRASGFVGVKVQNCRFEIRSVTVTPR